MEVQKPSEKRLTLNVEGYELKFITCETCEGEWSLCVENCHGIRSHWFECFTSADAALEEGHRVILEEGIDEFIAIEGVDYLARPASNSMFN